MMYQEFISRTGVAVDADEFEAIQTVYVASDLDKDEFCRVWRAMNKSRVLAAKQALKEENERIRTREAVRKVYNEYKGKQLLMYAEQVLSERELTALHKAKIVTEGRSLPGVVSSMREYLRNV